MTKPPLVTPRLIRVEKDLYIVEDPEPRAIRNTGEFRRLTKELLNKVELPPKKVGSS